MSVHTCDYCGSTWQNRISAALCCDPAAYCDEGDEPMLSKSVNPEIVRTASMPAPATPASVEALQAFENTPQVEAAVSASDRALRPGLGQ